ncbi:hypothetical protein J1614_004460 [Plenodomus biglobosus]|nr:hypothetical protein J1614_004460 [Plenodomus biglobosus]
MTSLFPHPAYAEDQPYAHIILYLHVMRASAMSLSFLSIFQFPVSLVASRLRGTSLPHSTLVAHTLKMSGRGLILGTAAGAAMTWGRMRGMEEIQWQDRTWRVLENRGEVETDWVSLGGAGGGAVGGYLAARRGMVPASMSTAVLGGAGVGFATGVPYMIASFAMGRKQA